jgi:MFS family permease
LKGPMLVNDMAAEIIVGISALIGMSLFIYFGRLSDRVGRKLPIIWGYVATLLLLFPLFWLIGSVANPQLKIAAERAPVIISGNNCSFSPFAKVQATPCGKTLDYLTKKGVPYSNIEPADLTTNVSVNVGDQKLTDPSNEALDAAFAQAGYNLEKQTPPLGNMIVIMLGLLGLSALSAATYGPVAALLSEMFPPRVRYSSMSIPYHFGTGYFGGFLPLIAGYVVARTGDPYSGLWYTMAVVAVALVVAIWGLPSGKPQEFKDD